MSKGKQIRCAITGERKSVIDDFDELYRKADGTFDPSVDSDCNLFNVRSIAAAAGYSDWRYFRDNLLTGTSSTWHVRKIPFTVVRSADGQKERVIVYATHSDSAEAGGKLYREHQTKQRRLRAGWGTDFDPKISV